MRGRFWRFMLVTASLCLASYFIGSWLADLALSRENSSNLPQPPSPGLFIDSAELNLGEIWEDPDFTATVQLRNTSSRDVAVSKFSIGCNCSAIEPPSPVVPANGSVFLRVKMDLTRRLPYAWGMERRPFALTIHPIVSQVGDAPNGWEFTAIVRSHVTLSALRLEFADECSHGGLAVTRKVQATAYVALAALQAMAQPRMAEVQIEPLAGSPGKYEIAVTPHPNLPMGPFRFEVPVTAVMPDGVRHQCAAIQVRGEMQSATRIVPGLVLLGEHPVGSKAVAEVSVRFPKHSSGWAVDHVEVESPHLDVTPSGTFEDGMLRYRLIQQITKRGDQVNKVRFVIHEGDGTSEIVEMNVRYHGEASQARNN